MNRYIVLFSLMILVLNACIYDYEPKNLGYENQLVVYGIITNETKPITVNLSRTAEINSSTITPESNASIHLIDGSGNSTLLIETENGNYSTIDSIKGLIGEEYMIEIITQDGNIYTSDFDKMGTPIEIGDVSSKSVSRETNNIDYPLLGYQFYVDIQAKNENHQYFRYEMDETWQITMPFTATHYWDGEEFSPVSFERICWQKSNINEFFIVNTFEYGSNTIDEFPLTFVSNETSRLRYKYCLNVKQYTMSEKAYFYWKSQFDNLGQSSLYSKQPYQVIGNIRNMENPDEVILGMFEVSSVSNKRIFVVDYDIDAKTDYASCELTYPPTWYETIYGYYALEEFPNTPKKVVNENCVNCELSGATPIMPDYWE